MNYIESPRLEELKNIVSQLRFLIDDPQPGLMSWNMELVSRMKQIEKFWNAREHRWRSDEVLKSGGDWLGEARNWLQCNTLNGDTVEWGSNDVIRPSMSVKQMEEFAASAVAGERNSKL